ncbi:hypothetical protein [Mesorhizobium sp. LSHC412B00]|uniref:hypothetical protein n=1 Tax=Mesorhizobium sp. LSHC412B00 TaxID=1287285 RepID=UPI0004CE97C7|nr:hypothetical protein [Mesorhizobium sp. LSHC412B00]
MGDPLTVAASLLAAGFKLKSLAFKGEGTDAVIYVDETRQVWFREGLYVNVLHVTSEHVRICPNRAQARNVADDLNLADDAIRRLPVVLWETWPASNVLDTA